ncbi:MAG: molybdopterin-binding protein, partial [Oscillospiraceae bacterium]
GGLGPTEDDLTKEIVSKVLGLKLVLDQKALDDINMFFVKSGRIPTENNIKQAYMPEGCKILYNKNGTAPGAIIKKNDKIAIILPGPPKEMIPMFDEYVAQFLSQKSNATIHSQTLRVFGIGESQLESKIPEFLSNKNPSVALYAKTGEVYIRITAKAQNKQQAVLMCTDVAKLLKEVLGEYIYSFDDNQMETIVIKELINKNAV